MSGGSITQTKHKEEISGTLHFFQTWHKTVFDCCGLNCIEGLLCQSYL